MKMKFFITNFSFFVLLLLIFTTYNESIKIDNNPDKSIIGNRHYRSLEKYKRDTSLLDDSYKNIPREEKKQLCTKTVEEEFGDDYGITIFSELSQNGNTKYRSTFFNSTIENKQNHEIKIVYLKFTAFSNGTKSLCQTFEWNFK